MTPSVNPSSPHRILPISPSTSLDDTVISSVQGAFATLGREHAANVSFLKKPRKWLQIKTMKALDHAIYKCCSKKIAISHALYRASIPVLERGHVLQSASNIKHLSECFTKLQSKGLLNLDTYSAILQHQKLNGLSEALNLLHKAKLLNHENLPSILAHAHVDHVVNALALLNKSKILGEGSLHSILSCDELESLVNIMSYLDKAGSLTKEFLDKIIDSSDIKTLEELLKCLNASAILSEKNAKMIIYHESKHDLLIVVKNLQSADLFNQTALDVIQNRPVLLLASIIENLWLKIPLKTLNQHKWDEILRLSDDPEAENALLEYANEEFDIFNYDADSESDMYREYVFGSAVKNLNPAFSLVTSPKDVSKNLKL